MNEIGVGESVKLFGGGMVGLQFTPNMVALGSSLNGIVNYNSWVPGIKHPGIATAVTGLAGALLIIVGPVEPTIDRVYIGRTFCVVVLAGLGSMSGTLVAGIILGVSETIVLTMLGASWAPAVSFGLLLVMLGIRPQGLFGR